MVDGSSSIFSCVRCPIQGRIPAGKLLTPFDIAVTPLSRAFGHLAPTPPLLLIRVDSRNTLQQHPANRRAHSPARGPDCPSGGAPCATTSDRPNARLGRREPHTRPPGCQPPRVAHRFELPGRVAKSSLGTRNSVPSNGVKSPGFRWQWALCPFKYPQIP